jgi:hypothetical protein
MSCWRDEVQKMQVQVTTGTPGAKATRIAGSAGEIRLRMDTSPAWWAERAIRWMTWRLSSTCVCGVRVCMILRVLYICCFAPNCIQLHCHCVCALVLQKIESDSRDSACEPAPSLLLRSSLTHAHRCIGPRNPTRPTPTLWVERGRESTYAIQSSCFVFICLWSAASE